MLATSEDKMLVLYDQDLTLQWVASIAGSPAHWRKLTPLRPGPFKCRRRPSQSDCLCIIKRLEALELSCPFRSTPLKPVVLAGPSSSSSSSQGSGDLAAAPETVTLSAIRTKLENDAYDTVDVFLRDMRSLYHHALHLEPDRAHITFAALVLNAIFESSLRTRCAELDASPDAWKGGADGGDGSNWAAARIKSRGLMLTAQRTDADEQLATGSFSGTGNTSTSTSTSGSHSKGAKGKGKSKRKGKRETGAAAANEDGPPATSPEGYTRLSVSKTLSKSEGHVLVGKRVRVWWTGDKRWYSGSIQRFSVRSQKHEISYDDGTVEGFLLCEETVELLPESDGKLTSRRGGGKRAKPATASADKGGAGDVQALLSPPPKKPRLVQVVSTLATAAPTVPPVCPRSSASPLKARPRQLQSLHRMGKLVWARSPKHPWWPAEAAVPSQAQLLDIVPPTRTQRCQPVIYMSDTDNVDFDVLDLERVAPYDLAAPTARLSKGKAHDMILHHTRAAVKRASELALLRVSDWSQGAEA